jgi:hypothetical protein
VKAERSTAADDFASMTAFSMRRTRECNNDPLTAREAAAAAEAERAPA